jgi:phage/plasmid primase-like uncharacterized protein
MRDKIQKPSELGGERAKGKVDECKKVTTFSCQNQPLNVFSESMEAHGLQCPDAIIPDGKIHRFDVNGDKPKSRNGWYIFFNDGLAAGSYGSWKTGESFTWCGKSEKFLSDAERAKWQEQIAKAKTVRDEEQRRLHAKAREKAAWIWEHSKPVTDHPYLESKDVKSYGLRLYKGSLVVPIRDTDNTVHNLQFINTDGDKNFLSGGAIRGYFYSIDGDGNTVLVCEGYSTSASVHEATGYPVVVALNAGNLKAAAEALRKKSPGTNIIICGDDDYQTEGNPGITKAKEAAQAVGAILAVPKFTDQAHQGTDFNDLYQAEGLEAVKRIIEESPQPGQADPPDDTSKTDIEAELWGVAEELFPRIEFPEILPSELNDSLKQLARSIGMPARSLPGICMSALGAALGDRISVSPKQSWTEYLIFWYFDIRPSGEGKTPAMQALIKLFHRKQKIEHDYYDLKKAEFDGLSAKDRKETIPPQNPRGYIGNTLTVEGLRTDLETNKTGGLLIALTEASSLISGQNEYKSKGGTDREAWITLHDGDPIRILRASKSIYISNSRVSIIGGIQPGVFRKVFTSEDGIFLVDGTVFRGLFTYDKEQSFDIDGESWSEENEKIWTNIIERAFSYSESQDTIKNQCLNSGAKDLFFYWRNWLNRQKSSLPEKIQGFLPKAYGYALRIAGVLHCIHKFHEGLEPTGIITREDMQRGIDGIMFYLGQTVDVVRLLAGEDRVFVEITEQVLHLAKTLESLKPELDSGRLAVGYIYEKFNTTCKSEQKLNTARAMGALLRKCGLTIPGGLFDSNGKQRVKCLQWNEKINSFIETCLERLGRLETEKCQGFQERDVEKPTSRTSRNMDKSETSETLKNRRLASESVDVIDQRDFRDIGDEFSKEIKKNEFEDLGAGCSDVDEDM